MTDPNLQSSELLWDFVAYCRARPQLRFWQALCGWSGAGRIIFETGRDHLDTFYWNNKSGQ